MTKSVVKNFNDNSYANISNISLFVAESFSDKSAYVKYDAKFEENIRLIRATIT